MSYLSTSLNISDNNKPTKITINTLNKYKVEQQKIAMLTCYDASFAKILNACGVDVILIGDSLGNVIQGQSTTIPVTIEHMVYHTECVNRGNSRCFLLTDMPFATYNSPEIAYANASKLMQAGAHMVKLEGGAWLAETINYLTIRGIPVCAHLGLTPQSVHVLGGFKKQATNDADALILEKDALLLEQAGASMVLFEAIPSELAHKVTSQLSVPTIGIGAGKNCDGQVLVLNDVLGIFTGKAPSFSKNYLSKDSNNLTIEGAIIKYVEEVKNGEFPAS
jgi:3-methyl-2-oxobutanoate hydroxymethyltransferase